MLNKGDMVWVHAKLFKTRAEFIDYIDDVYAKIYLMKEGKFIRLPNGDKKIYKAKIKILEKIDPDWLLREKMDILGM
jgi:hypothetical protein